MQATCSPKCQFEDKKKKEAKKADKFSKLPKLTSARNMAVIPGGRSAGKMTQYTQDVVNAFIKVRDRFKPCITCGAYGNDVEWHAGHFRSVGSAPHLRFHFWNIHKQCSHCNIELSGNRVEFEKRLPERIGQRKFELIKNDNMPRNYGDHEMKRIRKIAALKQRKEMRAA